MGPAAHPSGGRSGRRFVGIRCVEWILEDRFTLTLKSRSESSALEAQTEVSVLQAAEAAVAPLDLRIALPAS
jgi:hypothetical protein